MAASRSQLGTLAVAVVVLAAVIWWQRGADPATVVPAGKKASLDGQQGPSSRTGVVARSIPTVAIGRLKREASEPSDTGRDPFRFGAVRPVASGPGATSPQPVMPPVVKPIEPAVPAGPPPPPPIPLKFIAVISKAAGPKIAMLTDGHGVYYGVEGAVIEGQYRIVSIRADSIEMTYLDGRGRKTIPLSGS